MPERRNESGEMEGVPMDGDLGLFFAGFERTVPGRDVYIIFLICKEDSKVCGFDRSQQLYISE